MSFGYGVDHEDAMAGHRHEHAVPIGMDADHEGHVQPEHADDHCTNHLCFIASTLDEPVSGWNMRQSLLDIDVASLVNAATDGPRRPPRA